MTTTPLDSTQNFVATKGVHHLALTVSDVERSQRFYTGLLGFQLALMFGARALLSNGSLILALTPAPDPAQAIAEDRFNENRIGLDHVSFGVGSHADLLAAVQIFDQNGVSHGEIKDLGPDFGLYVLAFRDPDNIQIELTAPYNGG
jgi:glyoxylase I family protein